VKRATVRQRRSDAADRQLVNVVCPVCDGRHWLPEADTGCCTRRPGTFTITHPQQKRRTSA
jgi:hypothetical protein